MIIRAIFSFNRPVSTDNFYQDCIQRKLAATLLNSQQVEVKADNYIDLCTSTLPVVFKFQSDIALVVYK